MQALTKTEKEQAVKDFDDTYGITGGTKSPIGVTSVPVEFIRTAMSISELEPFDETQADAIAIYCVLRVPRHLAPTKDKSTFDNANTDMKSFYIDTIIPWANKYAQLFTPFFGIPRRYIKADFSHVQYLQEDRTKLADANKTEGDTWEQRWLNGVCSLNEWITATDGTKGVGPIYEKKLPEMTPEEIEVIKSFMSLKAKPAAAPGEEDKTTKDKNKKNGTDKTTPKNS